MFRRNVGDHGNGGVLAEGSASSTAVGQEMLVSIKNVALGNRVFSKNPSDEAYGFVYGRVDSSGRQVDLTVF